MDAELRYLLTAANDKIQYDTYAKKLLSKKCILSHILAAVVDEFKGMTPGEAERCIEGEVYVGNASAEPGLTNAEQESGSQRIVGMNTIQEELMEGLAVLDIAFYATAENGYPRILLDLEAQKDEPTEYD
ncbi:MAG: hypothetical protein LUH58_09810, partial [Lachnospiraceae bacterium]|nr:hypothetical protein [Lachnospiraceae bacterium]